MSLAPSTPARPRPALLNKTTNALLSPRKHNSESDMGPGDSISKHASSNNTPSSPTQVVGQKRSIDQVEVEQVRPSTATSSFNSQKREDEFYIYDDTTPHSSMDIDKEATFLQYSQKACDGQEKGVEKGCSQESTSMSSLLNLSFESEGGNCSSSNIARRDSPSNSPNRPHKVPRQQTTSSSTIPTDPEARRIFIQQKAGLLREKVQTAMKNIKDSSQIDRRLMELEAQSRQSWNASSPLSQHQKASSARTESSVDMTPKAKLSTPTGQDNGKMDIDNDSTPTQQKVAFQPETPAPSRPTDSQSRHEETADGTVIIDREGGCAVEKMMAKAKKETAVDGLLKLMKTTTEYDGLDEWSG
ncbi:uncharacterized protein GIQ15_01095 [Arthroderma uncinatum]|uniref:uncharacterized protein n=1 Tax=Arthroderma uncinatum TaxID=74035 RepID=UPI00144A5149|nr:uncharacterized protein GIQ15_01095 [Arthroderma uncinatum]KAF3491578.1 hypothetical protein GIQ15_01095 [Arthroderma uncinatum]